MARVKAWAHLVVNTPRLLVLVLFGDFLLCSGLFWAMTGDDR